MLQVQVSSGMFQVYVTSLNMLQGQTSFKGFMPKFQGLYANLSRALCHMFQGPRATTFQGLIAIMFMLQD